MRRTTIALVVAALLALPAVAGASHAPGQERSGESWPVFYDPAEYAPASDAEGGLAGLPVIPGVGAMAVLLVVVATSLLVRRRRADRLAPGAGGTHLAGGPARAGRT